jgi:ferredoxin
MNLLSLAEQIASLDLSPIHFDADRCLHSVDAHSTCDQCVRLCPTGALSLDKSIVVHPEACVACGQCLHDCPTGALTGPDRITEVWELALRLENAHTLEVACSRHPSPEIGPTRTDAVLRVGTCLAALSPAAYTGLLALGIGQVTARLDACNACPLGSLKVAIERNIAITRQILAARQERDRHRVSSIDHCQDWAQRQIYAKNRGFSRRDLFRRFVPKSQSDGNKPIQVFDIATDLDQPSAGHGAPRERTRLLNALRRLPPVDLPALGAPCLTNLPFAQITVDENCSMCGACSRVCPTSALSLLEPGDNHYELTFAIGDCINCGVCLKVCKPEALHRDDPTLANLLESHPITLKGGTWRKCSKCGAKFAGKSDGTYCPICEFRSQQPFGVSPDLLKQNLTMKRTVNNAIQK